MRAVVDTNLLLRMAAGEKHSPLFVAWGKKKFILVISPEMLSEFERVMVHPKVRRFLPPLRGRRRTCMPTTLPIGPRSQIQMSETSQDTSAKDSAASCLF